VYCIWGAQLHIGVTGQLADAIGDFAYLVFLFGGICETASCPVRKLAIRELAHPRVVQLPTLVPPDKYDWTVHVQRRCGLMSNYFHHLFIVIYYMVNFGPLAADIGPVVWGTPANFNGFRV